MLIPIIGVLVFLAVASLILGLARRSPSLIEARMQDFRTRAVNTVEGEADLSVPFSERVLLPSVGSLANAAMSVLPARVLANIEKQLVMAGSPMSLNAYVVFWMVSVFLISGLMLAAFVNVLEGGEGKLRVEALTELADRIGVEELTSVINSIIQAEQLGVGIAQVLRVQSDQMRTRRRQRAEKTAHEAPIKMIFPLVLFIFPAFMVVILGPAFIRTAGAFH